MRELLRLDEVLPSQLGRVHPQLARQHVHRPLDEVDSFRAAGAAISVGGRLVGEDLGQLAADRWDVVDAGEHGKRKRRHDRGGEQEIVSADVLNKAVPEAQQRAVALRRHVDVADDVAPVRGGQERFGAFLDPLHRLPELPGNGGQYVVFAVDLDLGAEATAHLGCNHPQLVLAKAQRRTEQ